HGTGGDGNAGNTGAESPGRGMSRPVLLAVAHGSRDPKAQQTVASLAERVGELAPGVEVRTAFVQNAGPSLAEAPAAVGEHQDVLVPLLFSAGYHLSNDVGETAARAGVPVAAPLGPGPGLVPALADRLGAAGAPPGTPVVLAAARSTDPRAIVDTPNQAALLGPPPLAPGPCAGRARAGPGGGGLRPRRRALGGGGGRPLCRPPRRAGGGGQLSAGPGRLPRPAPREPVRVGQRPARRPPCRGPPGPRPLP